jgi:NADH:ubiquinone oxidoreductase subunit 2 (subunit N)
MKVIVAMYMTESVSTDEKPSPLVGGVVMAAVVAVVLVGLLPDQLLAWATESIKMIKG